ncbi:hypothetical protein SAMN04488494_1021 [Xylanibacter ruminicola]|uniref:Uncharacterized protein n=1 Tax=Xylanibacter ruminicola TaxID=839 RepID=A0A1M7EBP6_XYLRU|nr:hypothetical protein [Xylanibacter ruminicola]SFC15435.1 hypothetical protein SAMN04488493_103318 [Xylanibacter ruminicola]SHL89038.1 hypothetical protein SAMN04488494_1021 [Xylanibacter ruminicola]
MSNNKSVLTPRWCGELAHYFSTEGSSPEFINNTLRRAAITIATKCAHPQDIEAQDLETIANALDFLNDIMDIVDKYERT